jgi:hypothetical protein
VTVALLLRPKQVGTRSNSRQRIFGRFDGLSADDDDLLVVLIALAERHQWRTHER